MYRFLPRLLDYRLSSSSNVNFLQISIYSYGIIRVLRKLHTLYIERIKGSTAMFPGIPSFHWRKKAWKLLARQGLSPSMQGVRKSAEIYILEFNKLLKISYCSPSNLQKFLRFSAKYLDASAAETNTNSMVKNLETLTSISTIGSWMWNQNCLLRRLWTKWRFIPGSVNFIRNEMPKCAIFKSFLCFGALYI